MDDATQAQIRELVREVLEQDTKLDDEQIKQVREDLATRYRMGLISRETVGWVFGAGIAFLAAVGLLSWSASAAGISNELSKRGVQDTLKKLAKHEADAANFVNDGFPLGSIVAWHNNILLSEAPTDAERLSVIDEGAWLRCDGDTLRRSEHGKTYPRLFAAIPSDVNEIKIPNLNGEQRFLRGGQDSGRFEEDTVAHHEHDLTDNYQFVIHNQAGTGHYLAIDNSETTNYRVDQLDAFPPPSWRTEANESETRPKNMSVVWMIRVK